jgi:hypothetical protein
MSHFKKRFASASTVMETAIAPFPKNCLVEVTNSCNHACVFCHNPFMHRKSGILDEALFERFVTEAQELGLEEIGLYSTGEPFLVKKLDHYISAARRAGIRRIYVTTNGALATLDRVKSAVASGLASIKFSINAATRESYRITHGRDEFDLVVENVRAIHRWVNDTGTNLQMLGSFIYTDFTAGEVELHKSLFGPYFEDTMYMRARSQGGRTGPNIAPIVEEIPHPDLNSVGPCSMLWNRLHVTCEGLLSACCVDYEHDLTYADYSKGASLLAMWNGPEMQQLRQRHLDRDFEGTICKNCLLGGNSAYAPLSDLRGKFSGKGRFEDETLSRIREASRALGERNAANRTAREDI